jgi:hypothetical protein
VLTQKQFKDLVEYAAEKIKEKAPFEMRQELIAFR